MAFDLHADSILVKVYFFPAFKSVQLGISKLDLVSQSIDHLNVRKGLQLGAFDLLKNYIIYAPQRNIDVAMLAFDCISPARSRLKMYVRSPYTSFDFAQKIMTLADKRRRVQMSSSLEKLHELWDLVTDDGRPKSASEELKHVAHRTAGILYNFEIKHGKRKPVPKVYIPVRHYGETIYRSCEACDHRFKSVASTGLVAIIPALSYICCECLHLAYDRLGDATSVSTSEGLRQRKWNSNIYRLYNNSQFSKGSLLFESQSLLKLIYTYPLFGRVQMWWTYKHKLRRWLLSSRVSRIWHSLPYISLYDHILRSKRQLLRAPGISCSLCIPDTNRDACTPAQAPLWTV